MQSPRSSRLWLQLGAGEARTEPYMKYGEGALEPATTLQPKSIGRVLGSAQKQADAARRRE